MKLTKSQRASLCAAFHRAVIAYSYGPARKGTYYMNYRAFRRQVQPTTPISVPYAGVWWYIEADGRTHA